MSSKFESGIRQIDAPQEKVYETLSNLQNLERVKDRIPDDKLQNLVFDNDSIGIEMAPVGKIAMRIVEREEPNTIKFESVESPMAFNFWIQLLPVTD
ncbi:MAG: SRPBCC family protein, partial [Prevotella sp.]|nr:SRPBCC family protein [Prevotella sp.]